MADASDLRAGVERLRRTGVERGLGLDGVHVRVRGLPPVEHLEGPDVRREVWSISKTVTALAVGIARAEGLLDLDDTVLSHLPGLAATAAPGVEAITVGHLLTMTSGVVARWDHPDADHPGDFAQAALSAPLGSRPGSTFAYRGANTYLLGRVVRAASGADLRDYLLPRLFGPLAIANPQWHRCPLGHPLGATGLFLRPREVARLGWLLLDGGAVDGRRLVPRTWVEQMTRTSVDASDHRSTNATAPHPDSTRYGRGIWHCARDGAWRMDGIHGQLCVVLPRHQACVTVTAHHRGATSDVLDAVWDDLVPALA